MDDEKETLDTGTPAEESEEESSTSEEQEKTVPLNRFQEVYKEKKQLETRITELEKKEDKGTLTDKDKQELEAKKYLEGLIQDTLSKVEKEKAEQEQKELDQLQTNINDFLAVNTGVKRSDFETFLEKKGNRFASFEKAAEDFLEREGETKTATDKAKEDLKKKPGLPSHEGGGQSKGYDPEKDRGKDLMQLAHEKINEFGLK